jgi:hypothetical protein
MADLKAQVKQLPGLEVQMKQLADQMKQLQDENKLRRESQLSRQPLKERNVLDKVTVINKAH